MKRFLIILFAAVLALCSCADASKEIRITSFEMTQLEPQGLTNLEAAVKVGIENPKSGFVISDIYGVITMNGVPFINVTTDKIVIDGRASKIYDIPFRGELADGFNPLLVFKILRTANIDAFRVNLKLKVSRHGGVGKVLEFNDLSFEQLASFQAR